MHNAHHANALHLYPQASYWDWPYTADSINNGTTNRMKQLDRDWMWFAAWGRYAWNCHRDRTDETVYWNDTLASVYGTTAENAALIRTALEESGEIAPKLLTLSTMSSLLQNLYQQFSALASTNTFGKSFNTAF